MKLKVPDIPNGIPSEKLPCPIGYTMNTADEANTGPENATNIHGRMASLNENSHSLPIQHIINPIK